MIRLLIADDHPLVLEGLRNAVGRAKDMVVAAEATSGQEVLDIVRKSKFDVLVLDFNMPRMDGLDILRELHREYPGLPILILSQYPEDQLAVRMLKAGAAGYMTKESTGKDLLDAVRLIHSGGKYISKALAQQLISLLEEEENRDNSPGLSTREFQVFQFIVNGKSVEDIGKLLSISEKTVRTYRRRVMQKVHVANDVELTLYAVNNHLVSNKKFRM
jgi:two-component system, NarL family, invasion response regulator UvrY